MGWPIGWERTAAWANGAGLDRLHSAAAWAGHSSRCYDAACAGSGAADGIMAARQRRACRNSPMPIMMSYPAAIAIVARTGSFRGLHNAVMLWPRGLVRHNSQR